MHYIKSGFLLDFLPTLPLTFIFANDFWKEASSLLFLVKVIRLPHGLSAFDSQLWVKIVSNIHKRRVLKKIKKDPEFGEDIYNDNNKFSQILLIKYSMNTLYLVITIFNISFLMGMTWYKYVEVCEYVAMLLGDPRTDTFEKTFFGSFSDWSNLRLTISVTYFAFTSLSTVGLGDLHPRSSEERLFCAFVLLFGVAIFSYIMGTFIEFLEEFKNFHKEKDEEEADSLSMFMQCMSKLNGNLPIN